MAINTGQMANEMGAKLPATIEDINTADKAGVTPAEVRRYREFTEKNNEKLRENLNGADREVFHVEVSPRINAMGVPPKVNLSIRNAEQESMADALRESRLIQDARYAELQSKPDATNSESARPAPKAKKAKRVAEPVENSHVDYEREAFDELVGSQITIESTINRMRDLRKMVENGAVQGDIVRELDSIIAMTQLVHNRTVANPHKKSSDIFADFTTDGFRFELWERKIKKFFPENYYIGDDGKKKFECEYTSLDVNSYGSLNTDGDTEHTSHHNYYVRCYACNKRGTVKVIYLGEYDKISELAIKNNGLISARSIKPEKFYALERETYSWRKQHADERGVELI